MNRINTSRQATSAAQRNCSYKPNYAIAQHVLDATTEIDSTELVLFENGTYFVASKFSHRYYRVNADTWECSAKDATVAKMMVAKAQSFATMLDEMHAGMTAIGQRLQAKYAA